MNFLLYRGVPFWSYQTVAGNCNANTTSSSGAFSPRLQNVYEEVESSSRGPIIPGHQKQKRSASGVGGALDWPRRSRSSCLAGDNYPRDASKSGCAYRHGD
jgi:hypothetical protein